MKLMHFPLQQYFLRFRIQAQGWTQVEGRGDSGPCMSLQNCLENHARLSNNMLERRRTEAKSWILDFAPTCTKVNLPANTHSGWDIRQLQLPAEGNKPLTLFYSVLLQSIYMQTHFHFHMPEK